MILAIKLYSTYGNTKGMSGWGLANIKKKYFLKSMKRYKLECDAKLLEFVLDIPSIFDVRDVEVYSLVTEGELV